MATRKEIRERLGSLMQAELVGDGHLLAEANSGPRGTTSGAWPVSLLGSVGSTIPKPGRMHTGPTVHRLRLSILVLYAAVDDKGTLLTREDGSYEWTETDAIDMLEVMVLPGMDGEFMNLYVGDNGLRVAAALEERFASKPMQRPA